MKKIHNTNVEAKISQLSEYLKNSNLALTKQRLQICEHIFTLEGHLTIKELYNKIQENRVYVSIATLYRTISILCDAKMLRHVQFGDNIIRYEQAFTQNHCHFICEKCKYVSEIEENTYSTKSILLNNCQIIYSQTNIFGICANCVA